MKAAVKTAVKIVMKTAMKIAIKTVTKTVPKTAMKTEIKKISVIFVCTGNICRSPTAEGVFREMVAASTLAGQIETDGTLSMHKQYLGRHAVRYFGNYDGEGTMSGKWSLGFDHGNWLIRIIGLAEEGDEQLAASCFDAM